MTTFKTGDKVKFLNDVGGGTIVSFIDKNTAMVSTGDGFDIPVLLKELLKIEERKETVSENRPVLEARIEDPTEPQEEEDDYQVEDEEIAMAFTLDPLKSVINAYLINSSTYHIYFVLSQAKEGEELIFSHGMLEPDTKISLGRFVTPNVDDVIRLNAGLLFYGNQFFRYLKPGAVSLKIDPSAIYSGKSLAENDYLDEDAAIFTLYSFREKGRGTIRKCPSVRRFQ